MREDAELAAIRAYYDRGEEWERLTQSHGQLEFERTKEIVLRHLPPPPAVVADIGGGPGRYTLWLAQQGYEVLHRDLMERHVEHVRQLAGGGAAIQSAVGDARSLDLADQCADAVLLLGPLYHLDQRADRVQALAEARRIAQPGRPVFAAAISRWAARMDGILRQRIHEKFPHAAAMVAACERTGRVLPLHPGSFSCYTHRPGQLRAELAAAGLRVFDLVSLEGPAFLLDDLSGRFADAQARQVVLETARALERVPELLGIGPHLLATAAASG